MFLVLKIFICLKKFLFHLHFERHFRWLKNYRFTDYFFLLIPIRCSSLSHSHHFWREIQCHCYLYLFVLKVSSFLLAFKTFSLSLALRNLILVCLSLFFFLFLVFGIYWDSCISGFKDFIKFRKIISSSIFLISLPFFFLFWELRIHQYQFPWSCLTVHGCSFLFL